MTDNEDSSNDCQEGIRNSVFEAYLEKEEICRRTEGMRKKGCKAG